MLKIFQDLGELFLNNSIRIQNRKLENVIKNYNFVYISNQTEIDKNHTIYVNMKKSDVIIINQCKYSDQNLEDLYFLIGFERTIILIKQSLIPFLISLFSVCDVKNICYLQNTKSIFMKHDITFLNEICVDSYFNEEMLNFKNQLAIFSNIKIATIFEIWKNIIPCISGYLIKQSYSKLNNNRINSYLENLISNSPNKNEIDKDEYIELRRLGMGSSFMTFLVYYIKHEELFVVKKPLNLNDEIPKLSERELNNYLHINHPFLPKFIGTIKGTKFIMIEFINGQNLLKLKEFDFDERIKLTIIFELMLTIQFLHSKHFIFRDLKPDNIMIDQNQTVVLIDFDRMLNFDNYSNDQFHSNDFGSLYVAPEVNTNLFSYKCDIYSIGKILFYIMNEEKPTINNHKNKFKQCPELQEIYFKCTDERPTISELLYEFYMTFYTNIKIDDLIQQYMIFFIDLGIQKIVKKNDENENDKLKLTALIFYKGEIVERDINKAIYYYSLAADKNDPEAQYNLGFIYYEGQFIEPDGNKAIYYYKLAANNNYANAYFGLGNFYNEGKFTSRNINKVIHYYSIASALNCFQAQYNLATIYMIGDLVPQDINKAIYYYSLASDQNFSMAQYNLGCIFYDNKLIERDINKAIHYFKLAADQNDLDALNNLGHIYYDGKYIERDIEKAIHYFQICADNKDPEGYFCLGLIYNDGYIKRDINKSIYYYSLAAKEGFVQAQYNLGLIYINDSNIHEAIYYFTLAANQNFALAQFKLGFLYSKKYYDIYDINKSIYYYTLAANQNNLLAQYNLALLYFEDRSNIFDINKSIYYFTLAANQNCPLAQYNLGVLYSNGQFIKRDIEKAIYYYSLASNQKFQQALVNLAILYHEGRYVKQDINKAIHYYLIAIEQKSRVAILNLGFIYYNGPYEKQNIYKAVHYFTMLADQNDPAGLFILGLIYSEGRQIPKDIKKAIHYYTLASDQGHL